jgi:chorismate mutase
VGESKRLAGLSVCDRAREREVVARVRRNNRGPLDDGAVARLFRAVIRESRRLQSRAAETAGAQTTEAAR